MENIFAERKRKLIVLKRLRGTAAHRKKRKGDDINCPDCQERSDSADLVASCYVCNACGHHFTISAEQRLEMLFDDQWYSPLFTDILPQNPIGFPGYDSKIRQLQRQTKMDEACICAVGKISGLRTVLAVLDSQFLMGSMGTAVGEKITLSIEYAAEQKLPLIIFSASGGARMQEGIFSLMQMAKTASAVRRFSDQGGLFISYLTHPTTGGVTASFASLGDIILAEPRALIGFAGPRVIEQTIKTKLPENFQSAESLLEHGFIDAIIQRGQMRETLAQLLRLHVR
jgi:acetyl-CoA carboxylase carboxyl transferase subunit beta